MPVLRQGIPPKAVVIGSGISGLAACIRLSLQGFDVEVFEANPESGGKVSEWYQDGFRFDTGPTLITMPELIGELFALAGKNIADYVNLIRPELPFNYFFDDGLVLHFFSDTEKLVHELASKTNDDVQTIRRYLDDIRTKFDLTNQVFLQNSLHILSNYFTTQTLRGVLRFGKVEVFKTMDKANRRNFTDDRLVRLFNSFASYIGSSPYKAPGVLNVISHFQLNAGICLPEGGMKRITNALLDLSRDLGVRFRFNAPVERILVEDGKVRGVCVDGEEIRSDVVISTMDVYLAYKQLMPEQRAPTMILNHPKSHSVLVFLWGMKKQFPGFALHNMILANDMRGEYDTMMNNEDVGDDFTSYIHISSKCVPGDAPEGCENWYVLINAPNLNGQDWDKIIGRVRKRLLERLHHVLGEDVSPFIAFEHVIDPRDHERNTNTAFGAIYGNSFNSKFSVFMRHANFSNRIRNLYFCGGSVHPGGGVPLSILSAKIATDLIAKKGMKNQKQHAG